MSSRDVDDFVVQRALLDHRQFLMNHLARLSEEQRRTFAELILTRIELTFGRRASSVSTKLIGQVAHWSYAVRSIWGNQFASSESVRLPSLDDCLSLLDEMEEVDGVEGAFVSVAEDLFDAMMQLASMGSRTEVDGIVRSCTALVNAAESSEMGERVSDEVLIESMARALLGGESRDDGVSSYQIALTTCHRCGVTTQSAGGEDVVADEVTVETARCDAQELGRVDVPTPGRATQTVPPRVRRAVLRRHHRRCAVPGCRQSTFVDVHHLDRQADGGDHHADNLIALCGAHHRATHVGTLVIRGSYSTGLDFEHADGSSYGEPAVEPAKAGVLATVLELLVGMGWKQREAQSMVDRVRAHVGVGASVEDALRAALQAAPVAGASVVREEVAVYQRLAA